MAHVDFFFGFGGSGGGGGIDTAGGVENHVALIVSVMAAIVVIVAIARLVKNRIYSSRHGSGGRYHSPWKKEGLSQRRRKHRSGSVFDPDPDNEDDEDSDDLEMISMADLDFGL